MDVHGPHKYMPRHLYLLMLRLMEQQNAFWLVAVALLHPLVHD
jgi:hypothetical protein